MRNGTTNLLVAVEPSAGQRTIAVTERRGKVDFEAFVGDLLTHTYAKARRVHLVLDNLNIHFSKCFDDVLGKRAATKVLRHMAEIEIGILSRPCLDRRAESRYRLECEVDAWQQARNVALRTIEWTFTRQDADRKLSRQYVPKEGLTWTSPEEQDSAARRSEGFAVLHSACRCRVLSCWP